MPFRSLWPLYQFSSSQFLFVFCSVFATGTQLPSRGSATCCVTGCLESNWVILQLVSIDENLRCRCSLFICAAIFCDWSPLHADQRSTRGHHHERNASFIDWNQRKGCCSAGHRLGVSSIQENHDDHRLEQDESGFLEDIEWHLQIGCCNNSALLDDQDRTPEVCAGLSEQVFDLQTPSITDRDVNSDFGEVFGSPPDLLSPTVVSYLSGATYTTIPENSNENSPSTLEAPSTTHSSTPESYFSISNEPTPLDPDLVATGQASTPYRSNVRACGLCHELCNGSEQLL